jgi:hypothetical protein
MQKLFGVISPEPASCGEEQAIVLDFNCKRVVPLEKDKWLVYPLKVGAEKMEVLKGRIVGDKEFVEGEKVVMELGLEMSLRLSS